MIETIETVGYAKKLGKYGFNSNLCANETQCEKWLNFCKKNNMKWFGDSYGTLVHKNFDNHFKDGRGIAVMEDLKLFDEIHGVNSYLNHHNILQSNINGCHIVTSSPNYIWWSEIKKYPYKIFIIHPSLLEDYNLNGINLAYCNMTWEEMYEINKAIYEDIGIYGAFRELHRGIK